MRARTDSIERLTLIPSQSPRAVAPETRDIPLVGLRRAMI